MRLSALVALSALSAVVGHRVSAQVTGPISGSVVDASGSAITSAAARLVSQATGVERKTECDAQEPSYSMPWPRAVHLVVDHPAS
jgi:hypothetical protein